MLKPARYMTPKVPTMRQRHRDARDDACAAAVRRKTKITITTSAMASEQLELRVVHRGADRDGAVGEQLHLDARRAATRVSVGRSFFTRSTTSITFAPGWRWTFTMIAGVSFIHAARRAFSASSTTSAMSARHDRRAVAVGDDDAAVLVGAPQLVVGVDGVGARRAVEAALGLVGVGGGDRVAHVLERQALGGEPPSGSPARAPPGRCPPRERHQAHARHLRDLLREARVHEVLHLRSSASSSR